MQQQQDQSGNSSLPKRPPLPRETVPLPPLPPLPPEGAPEPAPAPSVPTAQPETPAPQSSPEVPESTEPTPRKNLEDLDAGLAEQIASGELTGDAALEEIMERLPKDEPEAAPAAGKPDTKQSVTKAPKSEPLTEEDLAEAPAALEPNLGEPQDKEPGA